MTTIREEAIRQYPALTERLKAPGHKDLDTQAHSVEFWIALARLIRTSGNERDRVQLVARIQVLLVDAGRITDAEFVEAIQREE